MRSMLLLSSLLLCLLTVSCRREESAAGPVADPTAGYVAEGRGTWIGFRRQGADWDSLMSALAAAGFNMVFPEVVTGGAALYPSEFLPMVSERDELALLIEAAHKYGIEVHAWKINWYMSACPDSFTAEMERQGRIQISVDGLRNPEAMKKLGYEQNRDWLCPSHPANRELEKNVMLELARKYDVDGIHFDYMRYAMEEMCFCPGCRERFQQQTGLTVDNWPKDVWKEGKYYELYLDWRRELIQSSAREIARAMHVEDPYVCVTLAARPGLDWASRSDAQLWWAWAEEGILDFLCPMNYSGNVDDFRTLVQAHLPLTRGRTPYYSGMGVYEFEDFSQLKANCEAGRELGQDGFITFEINGLLKMIDQCRAELTSQPALLPHRAPETSFRYHHTARETAEGFPLYRAGDQVQCQASIMLRGKLREGVSRIRGQLVVEDMSGQVVQQIEDVDLTQAVVKPLSVAAPAAGRYRLALRGAMTLSSGETKPFITKSFPFQVEG